MGEDIDEKNQQSAQTCGVEVNTQRAVLDTKFKKIKWASVHLHGQLIMADSPHFQNTT